MEADRWLAVRQARFVERVWNQTLEGRMGTSSNGDLSLLPSDRSVT